LNGLKIGCCAAYLIELEEALLKLDPKTGLARWVGTPNPGPFFGGGNSPRKY
jgi:hypothetical protein